MEQIQNSAGQVPEVSSEPKASASRFIAAILVAAGLVLHLPGAGYGYSGILISAAGIIMGGGFFLYESRRKKWKQVTSSPFLKALTIFILTAVLISAVTSFTRAGIDSLSIWLLGFALAVTFWSLKISEKIIIPAVIGASIIESFMVLVSGPGGSLGNGNYAGTFLAVSFPFVFWLLPRGKVGICVFGLAFAGIGAALLMTGSRGALISVLLASVFGSLLLASGSRKLAWLPIVLIAGAALVIAPRFRAEDSSSIVRVELAKASAEIFEQHPVGIGAGNYEIAIEKYRTEKEVILSHQIADAYCPARNAHNSYIQVLCELGPLGLAAFLYMLFVPIYRASRFYYWLEGPDRPAAICAAMSLAAFAVQSLFNSIFVFSPFVLLFCLIAEMVDSRLNPFPLPTSAFDTQRHVTLLVSLLVLSLCCCFVNYRNIYSEIMVSEATRESDRDRKLALLDDALAANFYNERAYVDKNAVLMEKIRVVEEPQGSGKVIRVYGNLGEALAPIENLVNSVNPCNPVALFRLAKYNYLAGKFDLAEAYRIRLEDSIHGWYLTDYVLAIRAYMKGDIESAERFVSQAKLKNPRFSISIENLHERD